MDIKERIKLIIDCETEGSRQAFSDVCGWSRQYCNRVVNDGHVGLNVIEAILRNYPNIDARWLILGEGEMYMQKARRLRRKLTPKPEIL